MTGKLFSGTLSAGKVFWDGFAEKKDMKQA